MASPFFDVSDRTILSLQGAEALDLLQRISTNDVSTVKPGNSMQTVLTNEKGRMVDVVSVLQLSGEKILIIGQSPGTQDTKLWIEKFIIMEDINITDVTSEFVHILLPHSNVISREQVAKGIAGEIIFFNEILGNEKLTHVLCGKESKGAVVVNLQAMGYEEQSGEDYEEFRISHGVPGRPNELSLGFNPLEAGLLPLVSWTKGCYIGQEVISRLDSYKKVQRRLVKMHLKDLPTALPETIYDDEKECGVITSALQLTGFGEYRGLGYLNTSATLPSGKAHFRKGNDRIEVSVEIPGLQPTIG